MTLESYLPWLNTIVIPVAAWLLKLEQRVRALTTGEAANQAIIKLATGKAAAELELRLEQRLLTKEEATRMESRLSSQLAELRELLLDRRA